MFRDTIVFSIDDIETEQQLVTECRLKIKEPNVRFWPKADISGCILSPKSGYLEFFSP